MLRNKHLIAAFLVAPMLALGAYFGVDTWVAEQPAPAAAGQSYALAALSNCRYSSGLCTLKNGGFKVDIRPEPAATGVRVLNLQSAHPLQAARMALVSDPLQHGNPSPMQPLDPNGHHWRIELAADSGTGSQLRVAFVAGDAFYYGETALAFLD